MKKFILITVLCLFTLQCEQGWIKDILVPPVEGCTDSSSCNYNSGAEEDDGSCLTNDCAGVCGGLAVVNNCNVCDTDSSNDCTQDCAGNWGGTAIIDSCNVCGGTILVADDCPQCADGLELGCDLVCRVNPQMPDECGVCGGGGIGEGKCDCDGNALDCSGVCGGTDLSCDNTGCNDTFACNFDGHDVVYDGSCWYMTDSCECDDGKGAVADNCLTCDADSSNDCVQDCAGGWGGTVTNCESDCSDPNTCSNCTGCEASCCPNYCSGNYYYYNRSCSNGFCVGATSDYCSDGCDEDGCVGVEDCAGVVGGNAVEDCLGVCGGDTEYDCAGICGGDAVDSDGNGNCDSDDNNDDNNQTDCSDYVTCSNCTGCESSCCPNYCSGNYYYYNSSCSNGFCVGATSDYCSDGCDSYGCIGSGVRLLVGVNIVADGSVHLIWSLNNAFSTALAQILIRNGTDYGAIEANLTAIAGIDGGFENGVLLDYYDYPPIGSEQYTYQIKVIDNETNSHYSNELIVNMDCLTDNCGVCDYDNSNDCVKDCYGIYDGTATMDNCGDCVGGLTGESACTQDCTGAWGGTTLCSVYDVDGNGYTTVTIGTQEWLVQNLKVTHYNNGDSISYPSNEDFGSFDEGQYGVYDNDPSNADIYGNLYNWAVVNDDRGVCPDGFHVPSDEEFMELEMELGMSEEEANSTGWRGTDEGSKLAGNIDLWNDTGESYDLVNNLEFGTSGFNALPAGYRILPNESYNWMGCYAIFWVSLEYNSNNALMRLLNCNQSTVQRGFNDKYSAYSIRCIKD